MAIYDQKLLDAAVDGKLRTVSVRELLKLIVDGRSLALGKQAGKDLKTSNCY